jgi:hypothetical protein
VVMGPCFRRDDAAYGALAPRIFIDSNFKQSHLQPRLRDLAAGFARGLSERPAFWISEGAGNAGRSMRPQPRVQMKKHTSIVTTVTPEITRHSPRNGFTAYFVLSPVTMLV